MKRLIGFVIISALAALVCCSYWFGWLSNVKFIETCYTGLSSFGKTISDKISFIGKLNLKPQFISIMFILCCLVVFFILYFLIFGLIAHSQKKKKKAKAKKKEMEEEKKVEELKPNEIPLMANGQPIQIPANAANGQVYQRTYQTTNTVNNDVLTEAELEEEFHWKKFVGGRRVVRAIVSIVLAVIGLLLIAIRVVWQLKTPTGEAGIAILEPLFKADWFKSVMGFFDNISNNVLRQFMPDPSDPTKNFFIGDVINGQTLYLQDLFEILIMLFVTFLVIMAYLLITALLCYCLRKPNAKKRANKAKEKYLEDVKNGTAPSLRRKNVGYGNTYITYFGQMAQDQQVVHSYAEPIGEAETMLQETNSEYISPTKAELLIGGSNFVGGDITKIATLDILDESSVQSDEGISYLESLGDGVKEVDEETKPYEEYEELDEEVKEETEEVVEEPVTIEEVVEEEKPFDLLSVDIERIFKRKEVTEDVDTENIHELIDFDEDGFAYRLEVNGEMMIAEGMNEDSPSTIDLSLAGEDYGLLDHIDELTLIEEPDFELINKVSLLQPEFVVASAAEQIHYPNISEEEFHEDEFLKETSRVYEQYETEVIDKYVPRNKPDELVATEEQEKWLERVDPTPLVAVDANDWPREDTMIDDVGALRIYLDEGEKSVEFDRTRKPNYLAPEIYELDDEEEVVEEQPVVEEKEEPSKALKPLHEIKERKKITPIFVQKKEEVEEKEEIKPLAGPLHEITERSQKKDIKPVEINSNIRFNLRRFQTSVYHGNLTSQQAFELGVTKVAPVVNPVVKGAANDNAVPEWMKRIKEREARKQGVDSVKIKTAEDIGSVWDVNTKEDVVKTVNDFSLRRKRKVDVVEEQQQPVEEENKIVVLKPKAPIKPVEVKPKEEEKVEEKVEEVKPIAKPLAPIHKINRPTNIKPTGIKPIKPIKPVAPINSNKKDQDK